MRFELEALSARPEDMTQAELADYMLRQLRGLADSIAGLSEGENEVATKAPPRPREGMLRYADGTAWNPASVGKGPVVHDGANWLPLYSTPGMLLAALLTVDGPGSGLNADLLDGNDGSYYLPASSYTAADVLAKLLTVDGPASGLNADLLDNNDSAYYLNAGNLSAGTLLAARMPALTGDVTTTVGTVATAIGANKVTLGMMAQVATARILGRNTAGTGNVEALSTLPTGCVPAFTGDVTNSAGSLTTAIGANKVTLAMMAQVASLRVLGRTSAGTGNVEAVTLSGSGDAFTVAYRDVLGDLYGTHQMAGDGSTSQPGFAFTLDNDLGLRRVTTNTGSLVAGSSDIAIFNTSGFGAGLTPTSRNNCSLQTVNSLGFPATQVASTDVNALDDYEEGTWTSTITAGSGSITSYTLNAAEYTKIGNRVLWYIEFTINTNGTAAAYLVAANFPFTFGQTFEGNGREAAALGWQLQVEGNATGASVLIVKWDNSYPTDGGNGRIIRINGQYRV